MKKKICLTILMIICFIIFNNKVEAVVMASICEIEESPYDNGFWDSFVKKTYDMKEGIIRLTDNVGNYYITTFALSDADSKISTVPEIFWLTDYKGEIESSKKIDLYNTFDKGYCPKSIVKYKGNLYLFLEKKNSNETIELFDDNKKNYRYVIYKYKDSEKNIHKIAEGYGSNGQYAFVGPDISLFLEDEISGHQRKLVKNTEYVGIAKYFKVDEVYASRLIAGNGVTGDYSVCEGKSEERCEKENGYEILAASSGKGRTRITDKVSEWLKKEDNEKLKAYNNIIKISKDTNFINTCEEIEEANNNSKEYDFSKINIDNFINKLSEGEKALREAYSVNFEDCGSHKETSVTSSIVSCAAYSDLLGIKEIVDIAEEKTSENMLNEGFIVEGIYSDVSDSLKEILKNDGYDINILDASRDLNNYTKLFYTAALYLKSKGELTETQKDNLDAVIEDYKKLIDEYKLGISPVVDCQTLLGEDLINKIKSYVNIVKIAIPIILIIFGIFDFTKAIFAGEEEMQKAKKNFIKRVSIAVLIFITPTILQLILSLANKVWVTISPDSCGIF